MLLDYSATKGAITAFTRSLSQQLAKQGIRVNQVRWTQLFVIPSALMTMHNPTRIRRLLQDRFGRP